MTVKELRERSGMSQQEFGDYFGIPERTIENWEYSCRTCSTYLIALMRYKLETEGIIRPDAQIDALP